MFAGFGYKRSRSHAKEIRFRLAQTAQHTKRADTEAEAAETVRSSSLLCIPSIAARRRRPQQPRGRSPAACRTLAHHLACSNVTLTEVSGSLSLSPPFSLPRPCDKSFFFHRSYARTHHRALPFSLEVPSSRAAQVLNSGSPRHESFRRCPRLFFKQKTSSPCRYRWSLECECRGDATRCAVI